MSRYAWRMDVAVWTSKHRPEQFQESFRPRLVLIDMDAMNREDGSPSVREMGWIEFDPVEYRSPREGWTAYHLPRTTNLPAQHDETRTGMWGRVTLREGETKHPRTSAAAALRVLLDLVQEDIDKADHAALTKVGPMLLPTLQQIVDAHVRRLPRG